MSSNTTATPAEPDSSTNNLTKSFADRLSFPTDTQSKPPSKEVTTSTPSKFNWADEVETPTQEKEQSAAEKPSTIDDDRANLSMAQGDGAGGEILNGSTPDSDLLYGKQANGNVNGMSGLSEPEFDVNVKLADLQDDPNNPLYSVKSFDDLNL